MTRVRWPRSVKLTIKRRCCSAEWPMINSRSSSQIGSGLRTTALACDQQFGVAYETEEPAYISQCLAESVAHQALRPSQLRRTGHKRGVFDTSVESRRAACLRVSCLDSAVKMSATSARLRFSRVRVHPCQRIV